MWPFKKKEEIVSRANRINKVLEALSISKHSAEGRDIRNIVALELLGGEHDTIKLYSKTKFTQASDKESIRQALFLLQNEGLLKDGKLLLSEFGDGDKNVNN